MTDYLCRCCGERHEGLPMSYGAEAPAYWSPSLSGANFERVHSLWTTPGREQEPPYFGWLSTELALYDPTTLQLKTHVHTQPVGQRPLIELEPTDHPLAVEQRTGITLARVQEFAETLLHPSSEAGR